MFLPVSTGTESIKIDQETPDRVIIKNKVARFYGSRCRMVGLPAYQAMKKFDSRIGRFDIQRDKQTDRRSPHDSKDCAMGCVAR